MSFAFAFVPNVVQTTCQHRLRVHRVWLFPVTNHRRALNTFVSQLVKFAEIQSMDERIRFLRIHHLFQLNSFRDKNNEKKCSDNFPLCIKSCNWWKSNGRSVHLCQYWSQKSIIFCKQILKHSAIGNSLLHWKWNPNFWITWDFSVQNNQAFYRIESTSKITILNFHLFCPLLFKT